MVVAAEVIAVCCVAPCDHVAAEEISVCCCVVARRPPKLRRGRTWLEVEWVLPERRPDDDASLTSPGPVTAGLVEVCVRGYLDGGWVAEFSAAIQATLAACEGVAGLLRVSHDDELGCVLAHSPNWAVVRHWSLVREACHR